MPTDRGEFPVEIRAFDPARHDRAGFDCGYERLNNFLRLSARKQQKADLVRVYVLTRAGEAKVLGYHSINVYSLSAEDFGPLAPKAAPRHGAIPALYLSMVAVDRAAADGGLGGLLVIHAMQKAALVAEGAGCHAIVLDVMTDGGEAEIARRTGFYGRFGFRPFPSNPLRMFITMPEVRAVLETAVSTQ